MAKLVTQTSLFNLPPVDTRQNLLAALPDEILPRVTAKEPVLIETWQKDDALQVHLLNYGNKPQKVTVQFAAPVRAVMLSPDTSESLTLEEQTASFELDIYAVLIVK